MRSYQREGANQAVPPPDHVVKSGIDLLQCVSLKFDQSASGGGESERTLDVALSTQESAQTFFKLFSSLLSAQATPAINKPGTSSAQLDSLSVPAAAVIGAPLRIPPRPAVPPPSARPSPDKIPTAVRNSIAGGSALADAIAAAAAVGVEHGGSSTLPAAEVASNGMNGTSGPATPLKRSLERTLLELLKSGLAVQKIGRNGKAAPRTLVLEDDSGLHESYLTYRQSGIFSKVPPKLWLSNMAEVKKREELKCTHLCL